MHCQVVDGSLPTFNSGYQTRPNASRCIALHCLRLVVHPLGSFCAATPAYIPTLPHPHLTTLAPSRGGRANKTPLFEPGVSWRRPPPVRTSPPTYIDLAMHCHLARVQGQTSPQAPHNSGPAPLRREGLQPLSFGNLAMHCHLPTCIPPYIATYLHRPGNALPGSGLVPPHL